MKVRKFFAAGFVVCLGATLLGGCRSEEQGRILSYKPGVYLGKTDEKLSDEQNRALRERAVLQGGASEVAGGPSGGARDVRKPGFDSDTLKQGTQNQKGS